MSSIERRVKCCSLKVLCFGRSRYHFRAIFCFSGLPRMRKSQVRALGLSYRGFSCDRHVGFPFTCEGIGKSNKMFYYFLFSSYHITKLQPSDKNINTHTRVKFQILPYSKSKVLAFFVIFLHTVLCKRKPRDFEKSCARTCVQRRANPL